MNNDKNACATTGQQDCGTKKCCPVRYFLIPALAVFVVMFVYEYLFHGVFMKPYYAATATLWRSEADMMNYMPFGLVRQVFTALAFTCLVGMAVKKCTECPIKIGVKIGFKVGLILGLAMFGAYVWLPLPSLEIPLMWLLGDIILGILMGLAAGACYKVIIKKDGDKMKAA